MTSLHLEPTHLSLTHLFQHTFPTLITTPQTSSALASPLHRNTAPIFQSGLRQLQGILPLGLSKTSTHNAHDAQSTQETKPLADTQVDIHTPREQHRSKREQRAEEVIPREQRRGVLWVRHGHIRCISSATFLFAHLALPSSRPLQGRPLLSQESKLDLLNTHCITTYTVTAYIVHPTTVPIQWVSGRANHANRNKPTVGPKHASSAGLSLYSCARMPWARTSGSRKKCR